MLISAVTSICFGYLFLKRAYRGLIGYVLTYVESLVTHLSDNNSEDI